MLHHETKITYTIRRNRLSRRMKLSVRSDGSVLVTLPLYRGTQQLARDFVQAHVSWIREKQQQLSARVTTKEQLPSGAHAYAEHKKAAHLLVTARIEHFNAHYKFSFEKISIRNQVSRWGSCSKAGNLQFNFKLVFLPAHLSDYIIVHELCHLKQLNHSRAFWALVKEMVPDPNKCRRELRAYSLRTT